MIGGASAFILTSDSDDNNDNESRTETTYYTIQASATTGGKISPSGEVKVAEGESKTFTFTADTDYELSHILIDGKRKDVSGSYTFSNVSKSHTISAVFEKVYKPVNPSQPSAKPTKYVVGMEVKGTPGTQYLFNPFNAGDMTVTLKYSDGTQKVTTDYDVSPADFNKEIGTLDVLTISYMGFEKLFENVKVEIGSETPISTFDELQYFAQLVNTEYSFSGKTVCLEDDIDMDDENWTPIGTEADPFQGTFDGNGHTLFNLNVSNTDSPAGLFGSMDGVVKNLTINDAVIIGGTSVGTVAGEIPSKGTINDVVVIKANITGNKNVGGIVGYAYGSITDCTVKGEITITVIPDGNDNSGYDNGDDVGGIVGYLGEGRYTVTGNKVLGTEGTPIQIKAYRDIGGIIGTAQTVNTGLDSGNNNLVSDNSVEYVTITIDQETRDYGIKDSNVGSIIGRIVGGNLNLDFKDRPDIICQVVGINALQSVVDDTEANSDFKEFVLAGDIVGNLTVTQKPDVKITIDGNGKTFAGSIIVDGKSARYETTGLTIKNVNFIASSLSKGAYINLGVSGDDNTRYTNNVTVQDCIFSYDGTGDVVAVKSYTGGDLNLKFIGCTVNEGMHSALQVANIEKGLGVIGCHIYSKNGINLNNTQSLYMEGCVIETEGYAVRVGVGGTTYNNEISFAIENCTLTSANDDGDTTIMIRGKYNNATLTINNTDLETTEISPSDSGMKILLDGKEYVSSTTGISSAINSGNTDMVLTAGSYDLPSVSDKDVTFSGTKDVIITVKTPAYHGSDVTFNGVTVKGSGTFTGVQHVKTVTYNDVKIVGEMCLYGEKVVFNNCTFELNGQYIWTYGAKEVEFNNCIFNTTGKAILIYNEGAGASTVTVKGCTFNATAGAKAGAIANQNCAAIEIDNHQNSGTGTAHKLITENNTYNSNFSGEWRIKNFMAGNPITVNGIEYTQIAIDGKLMTIDAGKNVTVL